MRIAILTSSYPRYPGDGTAPFVQSISDALAKLGHSVEVIAPYDPEVIQANPDGVKVHRFKYWLFKKQHIMGHGRALEADVRLRPLVFLLLPLYLLAAFITLWRVTGHQKSDVIYVHWVLPNGPAAVLVAGLRRIPCLISLHGSDIFMAGKNHWYGMVARWVFSRSAAVTACSQELKQRAILFGAPATTELIAWGADPDIFKPAADRKLLRRKYGWGDEIVIAALGRLVYKKGFDILLKALPPVLAEKPQIKVVIGGDGPLLGELHTLAVSLGIASSVDFIGRVPWNEVPDLLAVADIYALPSVRDTSGNLDGLPTVLLEAMGCGCAVVASNIGGVPLVIRDHENGLLATPGSDSELAKALETLIAYPALREELGVAARKSILEGLNWESVAQRIEKLLLLSLMNAPHEHRMGTIYRDSMLAHLNLLGPTQGKVLDVGCHDGMLLKKLQADFRVGIDLHPLHNFPGISLVQADARYLPFRPASFDKVYALDVIEHIEDDFTFSKSVVAVLAECGRLILTTPSEKIRLNPPFLTTWISRKWGHIYRLGYAADQLMALFGGDLEVKILPWNAPGFRFYYPFLRLIQKIFPRLVENAVRTISSWDSKRQHGQNGFQIMTATRKN